MSDRQYLQSLIERIERECPQRRPASGDERRAQQIMEQEFAALGLTRQWQSFLSNDSLYGHLALHYGLATLGTVMSGVAPAAGLLLHGLTTWSTWNEAARRRFLLRRLLPHRESQNLIATWPAQGELARRLVFLAHADVSLTGLFFQPWVVRNFTTQLPTALRFLERPIELSVKTQSALAALDLLRLCAGPLAWPLRPVEALLTLPSLLIFLVTLQVLLRDELVPGANDDLSGVAALSLLARRLIVDCPPEVELVFAVTGCEEPGFLGATALARAMEGVWDKERTVVLALDSIGLGELRYIDVEGDAVRLPIPGWLEETLQATARQDPRFGQLRSHTVPLGGTDAAPFLNHGWPAAGIVCLDPALNTPGNYHLPSDRSEHLDFEQLGLAVDFVEQLARELIQRSGSHSS